MKLSLKRRQSAVAAVDFNHMKDTGIVHMGLNDIGHRHLDSVMGRLGLNLSKIVKPKTHTINKDHHVLKDLFRGKSTKGSKTDETKNDSFSIHTKLTKGNLRAAISRRYKGAIAGKIVARFTEFTNAQDFHSYCDFLEKIINNDMERMMRIAFELYDFNQDKLICELDMYASLQN